MKCLISTLIFLSAVLSSQNTVKAQSSGLERELSQNRGLIMDYSADVEAAMRKFKEIKRRATIEFTAKQSIIDMEQQSLNEAKELINNRVEENMRLDVLVYHIKDKEKLLREQSRLDLKQQQLGQRIADFQSKIQQIERHLASNYLASIEQQDKSISSTITAYIEDLNAELIFE